VLRHSVPVNIDEAVVQGAELAGRWQGAERLGVRANYTYTDSEQKSGPSRGEPLGDSARHMANASIDWQASERFNLFLSAEVRSKRYRGLDADSGEQLYWKDYQVFHLGAAYTFSERVTLNARINNLLDRDFTSYQYTFVDAGDSSYTVAAQDDYNNKDKARKINTKI